MEDRSSRSSILEFFAQPMSFSGFGERQRNVCLSIVLQESFLRMGRKLFEP
jgi:hypothetical protein